MNGKIGELIYAKQEFIDEEKIVFVMTFVFEYKCSSLGDIIYKCYGYFNNTPQNVIDQIKQNIESEYNIIKQLSRDFPDHFIKTYEILKTRISLGPFNYKQKDYEGGDYNFIGFTMEKMSHDLEEDFKKYFDKKIKYDDFEIYKYMRKALESLCFMHKKQFSHRDIKLQNIFIDRHGNLKLGDLGTTKKDKKTIEEVLKIINNHKNLHSVVGTKSYMAPEIFEAYSNKKEEGSYDPYKADLFSLGMSFLNLVCFQRIPARNLNNGKDSHIEFITKSLSKITNQKFRKCFEKMLEFDHTKRPTLIDFKIEFDFIFEVEKKKYESLLNEENEVTVIRKFQNINLNDDIKNNDKTKLYWADIGNKSFNNSLVEYIAIDRNSISMIEGNDTFFDKNISKNESFEINSSNRLSNVYLAKYNNSKVIVTKISFHSSDLQKRFTDDINFILNKVSLKSNPHLVKYMGYVNTRNSYLYLVSQCIESSRNIEKRGKSTNLYSLHDVFKNFSEIEKFNEFFNKENTADQNENKNRNFLIRLKILRQLIDALKFLKDMNICFGDLNLKKILIDRDMNVKLRDYPFFQTSFRHRYSDKCSSLFDKKNDFFYWPPEFFDGYIDQEKSDMWALGICIHQLFSNGSSPWKVNTLDEYLFEVILPNNFDLIIGIESQSIVNFREIIQGLITKLEKRNDLNWVINKLESSFKIINN